MAEKDNGPSPELNLIEMLWQHLKNAVYKQIPPKFYELEPRCINNGAKPQQ